jgi:hypothetical protein
MTVEKRPMGTIRAARRLLQDPYAYIEDLEDGAEAAARSPLHLTENPWATLAALDGDETAEIALALSSQPTVATPTVREFLSKSDFRSECIRIFLPYVPPHLPRRAPQHQRDFIARNEQRPGKARFQLIKALRRYDLSSTPGIAPQFNREHTNQWDDRKLRQIEAQIPDED